jgi:hypothetical protein
VQVVRRKPGLGLIILLMPVVLLVGCGTEVARASIQSVGEYQLSFDHDRSPVDLWTDLDVEYIDETNIWYEIEFRKNGDKIKDLTCNPFDHSYQLMARKAVVRGVTKQSYLAPMRCEVGVLPAGEIQMDITLYAEGGRVRIFRADLVVREKE